HLRRVPHIARDRGGARSARRDRLRASRRVAALPDRSHGEREPRSRHDAVCRSAARNRLGPAHGRAGVLLPRRQAPELPLLDPVGPRHPRRPARRLRPRRLVPIAHTGFLGPVRSGRRRLGASRLPLLREGRASPADARRPRRGSRALTEAASLARASRPDDEWPGVADPEPIAAPSSFHEETAATTPEAQANSIGAVCAAVPKSMRAAGTAQIEVTEDAVANTRGVAAYAPATMAYLRALVQSDTYVGSGYAEDLSMRVDGLHPETTAARA